MKVLFLLSVSLFALNGYASEDCSPMRKPKTSEACFELNQPGDGKDLKVKTCTWDAKRDVKCECCVLND